MSVAVSLRNVVRPYRRGKESVEVLYALSLQIPEGEFASLMDSSGSGTTTSSIWLGPRPCGLWEIIVGGGYLEKLSGGQLTKWRSHHIDFIFQFYGRH